MSFMEERKVSENRVHSFVMDRLSDRGDVD